MKRATIIFITLFILTLLIPMISIARSSEKNVNTKSSEQLVTIFSTENNAEITLIH